MSHGVCSARNFVSVISVMIFVINADAIFIQLVKVLLSKQGAFFNILLSMNNIVFAIRVICLAILVDFVRFCEESLFQNFS